MKHIKTVLRMMRYNRRALVWFEILYKLLGVTVFVPLFYGAFNLSLKITGYRYLTVENIYQYVTHPAVYLMALLGVLLVLLYTTFDVSAVIYILHHSYYWKKAHMIYTIKFALKNTLLLRRRKNRFLLVVILVQLLFFSSAYVPELLASYDVPNFLQTIIQHRGPVLIAMVVVLVSLFVPFIRQLFAFHYYTLEGKDTHEAFVSSRALGTRHHFFDFVLLLAVQVVCYLLYILFLAAGIFVVIVSGKLFGRSYLLSAVSISLIKIIITVLLAVFSMLGVPACTSAVSMIFYHRKTRKREWIVTLEEMQQKKDYVISESERKWRRVHRRGIRVAESILFVATLTICTVYIYRLHRGELNLNVEYLKTMEVTAHRGASWYYPENTMSAFQGALDAGADWIELDVQESKDGQIFCMHDRNFKRTTGVNAKAWELTYDEISRLDAGSRFRSDFAGEQIPLLKDVIEFAKENGIRLNIEIKPSPEEEDLEERLVELLQEEDFIDQCVVTSQMYDSIVKVKQMDETITTVYVMAIAYGNVGLLAAADHFSVRSSSITDGLVSRVHNAGKQIYAWTVNSSDAINLMIEKQVDNIITDNVPLAKKCIGSKMTSDAVNDYVSFLNRQMRLKSFIWWK